MKQITIIFLLIFSIAQAQTTRVQSVTNGGILIWTAAGVDSAKRAMRNEQQSADRALSERIAALERSQVRLRQGTVDSLDRLSVLLNELSTRIAQQGASLSSLNATVAGNVAGDNAQAVQISSLVKQIGSYDTLLPIIQAAVKAAQDAANGAQGTVDNLKNYIRAIP